MFVCSISSAVLLLGTSYTSSYSGLAYGVREGKISVIRIDAPELRGVIREGDQIVEFDGKPLTSSTQMREFFILAEAGTPYQIVVLRDGQRQKFALQTFPTTAGMSSVSRLVCSVPS